MTHNYACSISMLGEWEAHEMHDCNSTCQTSTVGWIDGKEAACSAECCSNDISGSNIWRQDSEVTAYAEGKATIRTCRSAIGGR